MAIYHLEAKVVSRGTGRSAVAASAYLSCSKIFNDYDGVQHDYTVSEMERKKALPPLSLRQHQQMVGKNNTSIRLERKKCI